MILLQINQLKLAEQHMVKGKTKIPKSVMQVFFTGSIAKDVLLSVSAGALRWQLEHRCGSQKTYEKYTLYIVPHLYTGDFTNMTPMSVSIFKFRS